MKIPDLFKVLNGKHTTYNKFKSLAFLLFYNESRSRDMVVVFLEVKIL